MPSRTWTLAILAYLLMHRTELVPRKRLAFTLWPDELEEDALARLRQNLHRLVKALPPAPGGETWFSSTTSSIALNRSAPLEFDVAEFERLRVDEATREAAVAVYGGEFLCDFDADWIATERERLRALYLADLSTLVRVHRSRRSFERAAHFAQQLLASDPWHEECLRALVSVRYELGDAAGALAELDAFARRLRADMNAPLMPESIALRDAIARGIALPSTLGTAEASTNRKTERTPFVGRGDELEALRRHWLRAAKGNGSLLMVRGEAGIGKSRIVAELALTAESEGGRVLLGRTSLPERNPYQCLASALRDTLPLVAGVQLAPPFVSAIAELVPELRAYRKDIPELVRLDPERERQRLFDALAQLFAELARPRPLVLILEDLHRAGTATIDAIAGIVPRLSRSPVLVVATCRPENVDRAHPLRRLLSSANLETAVLDLGPLSVAEIRSLVDAHARSESVSPEFFTTLCERSGGNSLFVTEFLRDAERMNDRPSAIPETVKAMITERVASLAAASITVADVAAVAGEAFSIELVREIAHLPSNELLDGIDELLDRHLIRETTGRGRYEYAFTHHLIRAAIYENVPPDARLRRHRRIARILEAAARSAGGHEIDERAGEIALHFERGGDAARAAVHYANAARRAAAFYANDEARELIGRSLHLDPRGDRERFDLLLLRSKLNARLGDNAAEDADVNALEEIARRLDPEAVGVALLQRIDLARRTPDRERECREIERLRTHATTTRSERWFAAADEALARRAYADAEPAAAIEAATRARDRYRLLGDDGACARVAGVAASASIGIYGDRAEERFAAEALLHAERAGDPEARISALYHAANVALDYDRAAKLLRTALAIAVEIGDRIAEARCLERLGAALRNDGKYEEAATYFRSTLSLCETLGLTESAGQEAMGNLGVTLAETDPQAAVGYFQRAAEENLKHGSTRLAINALNNLAFTSWILGELDLMSAALDRLGTIVSSQTELGFPLAWYRQNVGTLLRCRRQFDAAVREFEKLAADLEKPQTRDDARALLMLAEVYDDLALTYLADGRLMEARRSLDRNADVARRSTKKQNTLLFHHWIDACVHRAQGRPDDARLALARAHEIYCEKLGKLSDPNVRASFAEQSVHRAIRRALEHDEWPSPESPCVIAFPSPASAPQLSPIPSAVASAR